MISEDEVRRVSLLARILLTPEETEIMAKQLSGILQYFENVSKIDTEGVEPLVTATEMAEFWRPDEVQSWTAAADLAMRNSPERVGNLFKVPPTVG